MNNIIVIWKDKSSSEFNNVQYIGFNDYGFITLVIDGDKRYLNKDDVTYIGPNEAAAGGFDIVEELVHKCINGCCEEEIVDENNI